MRGFVQFTCRTLRSLFVKTNKSVMEPTLVKRQKLDENYCSARESTLASKVDVCESAAAVEAEATPLPPGPGDVTPAAGVDQPNRQLPEGYKTDLRLTEKDVGITEYISQHEGFSGILKQRYSDFVVNEISEDGSVVRLTDFTLPKEEVQDTNSDSDTTCISPEDMGKLQELSDSKDKTRSVCLKVSDSKEERTKIHKIIRIRFPGLESTTEEEGLQKLIKVTLKSGANQRRNRWPQGRGDYCKFVLSKANKDTMDALNLISKLVRVKPNLFTYAGTKDRRAKTSQEVTAYRVTADVLQGVNSSLRNMAMGNFRYCRRPLRLGQLKGNRFTIILREVSGDNHQIEAAMKSLADVGFINYYGMQRFGTTSVPTHHIGRALMCNRWKEAVDLILMPRNEDDPQMAECRRVWWETQDASKAASLVSRQSCIEQSLLRGLVKCKPNDFAGALTMISKNTRTMYIHSYQSYVWNSLVSRRIKQFGLNPVSGDLVLTKHSHTDEDEIVHPEVITNDNIKDYGVEDIVMPLPGYDIVLPQNDVADWYKTMLQEDGMNLEQFKHKNRDYALPGAYRKILVKPADLTWSVHQYNDPTVPLVLSDLETLNGDSLPEPVKNGNLKALQINVSLPTSCYATMAIRDVLKMDTSSAFQSTLNPT